MENKFIKKWSSWWRLQPKHKELTVAFEHELSQQLINFANFIGDRPLPEYSKSTDTWRWWDNTTRKYKYASTKELLEEFGNQ